MKRPALTDDDIQSLCAAEIRQSLGYTSTKLSAARQKALYYYLGQAIGDLAPPEIDGRSSVVSTDVRNTIEAMLPQLMVTFTGGDEVATFDAQGPEDEGKAKQATEYINYLFFKKNPGHRISYTWMKDALLQKNGIVKCWWDTRFEETKEEYKGLTQIELAQILDDEEIEVTGQNTYPDEEDAEQRQQAIEQLSQQLQRFPPAHPAVMQIQAQIQQIQSIPPAMLYDVVCVRTNKQGKIQIENVPPEEFLIDRQAKDIPTARFCAHRTLRTKSELKSMGYKRLDEIGSQEESQSANQERIQRLAYNDENAYVEKGETVDEATDTVWVTECYLRCDADGDGIVELRKITMSGDVMLDNEEVDCAPFVSITPIPLSHTFFGLSVADMAMESQKTNTSLLRASLDNTYLQVNGRYFAVEGQVNLDDLLTSRPGGVVRIKNPNAVGRLDQGMGDMGSTQFLMQYMQEDLENRTGWSRQSMGNDASGIQTTATAANIVTNKADMRLDLIARNFAEGFTDLFKLMLKLIGQHQDRDVQVKLSGGWVNIDPREWRNQFDVSINVGIGLGNKDQKIQHMMALIQHQAQVYALGVANSQNVYESSAELSKLLGYKNGDKFFTDPQKQPPPNKPDPEMVKGQVQMAIEEKKMQTAAQLKQIDFQLQDRKNAREIQRDIELARQQQEFQAQQDTLSRQLEERSNMQKAQYDAMEAERQRQHEAMIAEAKATIEKMMEDNRLALEKYQTDTQAQTQLTIKGIENQPQVDSAEMFKVMHALLEKLSQPAQIVRDPVTGKAMGMVRG
ncbi:MAG: hypothetical protein KGL39_16780 [Patescibacteria group bacterium]|nr:hypothetical protein [Patescibacteria group bacterium]